MRDGSVGGVEGMAGNKRRDEPEGITGAAAARVPARYDAASVRDVRSAQRPGGSKKRRGTGSRTVQRTSRNSRYEQDERRRPSGRSPQAQRMQRSPPGRVRECSRAAGRRRPVQHMSMGIRSRLMRQERFRKSSFYDLSLVVIIIVLTVFGLVMIYSASSYTAH